MKATLFLAFLALLGASCDNGGGAGPEPDCLTDAECDDQNGCTADACNAATGKCEHTVLSGTCNDGDKCTVQDVCSAQGVCAGVPRDCDDQNGCTADLCDADSGECVHTNLNDACDDGNACTEGTECRDGACTGGTAVTCDDGNPCTDNVCEPATGCTYPNNTAACEDGDRCTVRDTCVGGACEPGQARSCDDQNACTDDSCDAATGCVHMNNAAACEDGNACTVSDTCKAGMCQAGTEVTCDDSNPCTSDTCDPGSGCQYLANTDPCEDGNFCTVNDRCSEKACLSGTARTCDDRNACTDDSCDPARGCVFQNNTASCDDGNSCNSGDICQGGVCAGTGGPDCDDHNPCTDDTCEVGTGCRHTYNTAGCDDGNACTQGDICSFGVCAGVPKDQDQDEYVDQACGGDDCDDLNPLMNPGMFESDLLCSDTFDNNCNGLTDTEEPTCQGCDGDLACDDHNRCNGIEICDHGTCRPGTPLVCGDENPCTTDRCVLETGCESAPNTDPCSDGNACTVSDVCAEGACQPGQESLACGDQNPCTDDSCDPATGCTNTPNATTCDDGNPCTEGDTCAEGSCLPGMGAPDCDDQNSCTEDSCRAGVGCIHEAQSEGSCDDGNACTASDHCSDGACVGATVVCNDNNVCTEDRCDQSLGCIANPVDGTPACNDNQSCTTDDLCIAGQCVGTLRDQDQDGYGDEACGGDDCDDENSAVSPVASEICGDGVDNNCDDVADLGCSTCTQPVAAGDLRIDNDLPMSTVPLTAGSRAINAFLIESDSYNVLSVDVGFIDFCPYVTGCANGDGTGSFRVVILANPTDEIPVASSQAFEVQKATGDPQPVAWQNFPIQVSPPVGATKGEVLWVAVESLEDQSANLFLPLTDAGNYVGEPYLGGFVYLAGEEGGFGEIGANWLIRLHGCGDGPRLVLSSASGIVTAGSSRSVGLTMQNKGFATANQVTGTIQSMEEGVSVSSASSSFGNITAGGSSTSSPPFQLAAAATASGLYPMSIVAKQGLKEWKSLFDVYVQGEGCNVDNASLATFDLPANTQPYLLNPDRNDLLGNYYVVTTDDFSLTKLIAYLYREQAGSPNPSFQVEIYTYLNGYPLGTPIGTSDIRTLTGSGQTAQELVFTFSPPLTFQKNDVIWALLKPLTANAALPARKYAVLLDAGSGNSWFNGIWYDSSASQWIPLGVSLMHVASGCRSVELLFESYSSQPSPIAKGGSATLGVTVRNKGALTTGVVTGFLSSSDGDIAVTPFTGSFGQIAAEASATASGFTIQVAAEADQFQYVLDLNLTETYTDQNGNPTGSRALTVPVPIQLAGGIVNITVEDLTTTVVGNDLQFSFQVVNRGNVDVVVPFDVAFYLNRDLAPAIDTQGDTTVQVPRLSVGESIPYSLVIEDAEASTYRSWVLADWNGAIAESDESDNVAGPSVATIGQTSVFELLDPPKKWFPADMPVDYRFVQGNSQPGMTAGTDRQAVQNGFQHWQDAEPATITFAQGSDTTGANDGFVNDGYNTITFNDPNGEVPSGAIGATLPIAVNETMQTNAVTFYRMVDADIVINNSWLFVPNGAACSGNSTFDLEGIATHEIGHLVGLDHPEVFEATMYYAVGPCDMTKASLSESDINGVSFIYP